MADEYARKAALRDAARAKTMRRAVTLLKELEGIVATWDLTAWTAAIAGIVFELEFAAREDEAAALECFDDTPLPGPPPARADLSGQEKRGRSD